MSKRSLFSSLKWLFSILVLVVLVKSGKLSLSDLAQFFKSPETALACFIVGCIQVSGTFYRWKMLLKSQGAELSYPEAFKLGMLGQFFSAIIPGTVGGDLVKAVYVAKRFPKIKGPAVSTLVLDRVTGLMGMILLATIAFVVGYPNLGQLPEKSRKIVEVMGLSLSAGTVVICLFLASLGLWGKKLPTFDETKIESKILKKVVKLYDVFLGYRNHVGVLWKAVLMSTALHTLTVLALFLAATAIFGPGPWGQMSTAFFVLAGILGMSSLAVPIAPGGLGVGQVAFAALFVAVGAPGAAFGAAIITAQQLCGFTWNLLGVFFFATYKHEVQEVQAGA